MKLSDYLGKNVTVYCTDGSRFTGRVFGMTQAADEECGVASIDVERPYGSLDCIYEDEIDHIELLD